jgi:hypothetical protein
MKLLLPLGARDYIVSFGLFSVLNLGCAMVKIQS